MTSRARPSGARRSAAPAARGRESAAASDEAAEPDEGTGARLTLDEASEMSGVPARTIRYYQAERLLPKPERDRTDGRVARYGPHHIERLRLIGELRDRGLKLPAIRTLLQEGDASTRVSDWLGLDEKLRGSWGNDAPRVMTRYELAAITEGTPPGTQSRLEDAGLLVRQGDAWLLPEPGLLELSVRLISDGVDVDLVLKAGRILQRHLGRAADQLVDLFVDATQADFGSGSETDTLVNALRPAAGDAARTIFAGQLERAIDALLADTRRLGSR